MTTIMRAKAVVDSIIANITSNLPAIGGTANIATIGIASNDEWMQYVNSLSRNSAKFGCIITNNYVDENVSLADLTSIINALNVDNGVDGIILQQPLPEHLCHASGFIDANKDIDGLTINNIHNLFVGKPNIMPATALAVVEMLNYYNYAIEGKHVAIVGSGLAVGKPLALLLNNYGATVTMCNDKTNNLKAICRSADIIVSACGVGNLIDENYVSSHSVVVDIGLDFVDGKMCGDVNYDKVASCVEAISPVPGGIGPITQACLFENAIKCALSRAK